MQPPMPSSLDPESPAFQSTSDVLTGPPERDKLADPIIEDILEPRSALEGGICSDDGCILQENTHSVKETIGRADVLTVPIRDESGSPEGDESICQDDHSDSN